MFCCVVSFSCSYRGNTIIKLPPGQDFLVKDFGRIHRSCLERFGGKFITALEEGTTEGLACLKKLASPAADKNLQLLRNLFASNKLVYFCAEHSKDWKKSHLFAHASINEESNLPIEGIQHPYVSYDPQLVLLDSEYKGRIETYETLKAGSFHELFHNIGYVHGITIEYPYACEECCFPAYGNVREIACKLCAGDYQGIGDRRFLADLKEYQQASFFGNSFALDLLQRRALFNKPADPELLKYLFEVRNLITDKTEQVLSRREGRSAWSPRSLPSTLVKLDVLAEQASKAQLSLYLSGNAKEALGTYQKMDPMPLEEFLKMERKSIEFTEANRLWDEVLFDLDMLSRSLFLQRDKAYREVDKIYHRIHRLKPLLP